MAKIIKKGDLKQRLRRKTETKEVDAFADLPPVLAHMLRQNSEWAKSSNAASKRLHETEFKNGEAFDIDEEDVLSTRFRRTY